MNLPEPTLLALLEHEKRQEDERTILGDSWIETGYIFTSSIGTPIDPRNLYREFQGICRRAGLGDWHPHELRHSAASLMLAQGVKIQVVSQVLGHASIRMTADVYGHLLEPDRKDFWINPYALERLVPPLKMSESPLPATHARSISVIQKSFRIWRAGMPVPSAAIEIAASSIGLTVINGRIKNFGLVASPRRAATLHPPRVVGPPSR